MYSFNSRVRFSETDAEGRLSLDGVVDYFQDCSTFQTEDLGVGFSYLKPLGMTWVLSYWHIIIDEYPRLGDEITIGTLPYDFRAFMGKRNFFIKKGEEMTAKGDSLWILLDTEKMSPVKIPENLLKAYPREEKIDMVYAPRKIEVPKNTVCKEPIIIQNYHLDCNKHVNNGQYIKIALTYLPDGFKVRQLRAEYKKQAYKGDEIFPYIYTEEGKFIVGLYDNNHQPVAIVEFKES